MKPNKVVLAYSVGLDTSVIAKWLMEKYGADVRPWEFKVTLDNKDWKNTMATGQNKIFYTYSLRNDFSLGQINQ